MGATTTTTTTTTKIMIYIITTSRKKYSLIVNPNITAEELKNQLRNMERIKPELIMLIKSSKIIPEGKSLASCGIIDGSVIVFKRIVRGC